MNDSIFEAIHLLESECDEINRAIVRLSLRKEKLQDTIRLLRDRSLTPLTDTVQPLSNIDIDTDIDTNTDTGTGTGNVDTSNSNTSTVSSNRQTPSTSHLVRETLKNASNWMSVTAIRSTINRPQTQIQAAIQLCISKGLVERQPLTIDDDDDSMKMPLAKWEYRWRVSSETSKSSVTGEASKSHSHSQLHVVK